MNVTIQQTIYIKDTEIKKKLETNDLMYFTFLYNFMRALFKPKKYVHQKKYYNKIISIYFTLKNLIFYLM